jgi:hypothetical protein
MRFNFKQNWGDIVVSVLACLLLFHWVHYSFSLFKTDFYNIRVAVLLGLSIVLILINVIGLFWSRSLWHLIWIILITTSFVVASQVKKNDYEKINTLFLELSKSKPPFPIFLSREQSEKGPIFNRWVYKNKGEKSFVIYLLYGSELYGRDYPDDKGWQGKRFSVVSNILFRKELSEMEREVQLDIELNKMKDDDPLKNEILYSRD